MLRFALPATVFALATLAPAQRLDFTSAERSYFLATAGFGHDFDEYTWTNPTTHDIEEAWVQNANMTLHDYSGHEVSHANVSHDSHFQETGFHVTLNVDAGAPPAMHSSVDATGQSKAKADFHVAVRGRYALNVNMVTSPQAYSVAYSALQGPTGTMYAKQVFQGGTYATGLSGWLQPGNYQFDSEVDASVQANYGQSDSTATSFSFDLQVFHAGDFDLNEDVDHRDRGQFRQAYFASNPTADVDGNGVVNLEDWRLYHRAWFNGFFQGIGL